MISESEERRGNWLWKLMVVVMKVGEWEHLGAPSEQKSVHRPPPLRSFETLEGNRSRKFGYGRRYLIGWFSARFQRYLPQDSGLQRAAAVHFCQSPVQRAATFSACCSVSLVLRKLTRYLRYPLLRFPSDARVHSGQYVPRWNFAQTSARLFPACHARCSPGELSLDTAKDWHWS